MARCAYAVQYFSAADGQKLMVGFRVYLPPLDFAVVPLARSNPSAQ
ncbi:MAG TPA: hypothetical protein V6D10_20530 [Trichocoleus sp.]